MREIPTELSLAAGRGGDHPRLSTCDSAGRWTVLWQKQQGRCKQGRGLTGDGRNQKLGMLMVPQCCEFTKVVQLFT